MQVEQTDEEDRELLRSIATAVRAILRKRRFIFFNEVFGAPRFRENPNRVWDEKKAALQRARMLVRLGTVLSDYVCCEQMVNALFLYAETLAECTLESVSEYLIDYVRRLGWWDMYYPEFESWLKSSYAKEIVDQCRCTLTGLVCRFPLVVCTGSEELCVSVSKIVGKGGPCDKQGCSLSFLAPGRLYDLKSLEDFFWSVSTKTRVFTVLTVYCLDTIADLVFHWKCEYINYIANRQLLFETSCLHDNGLISDRDAEKVFRAINRDSSSAHLNAELKKMYSMDTGLFLRDGTLNAMYATGD